MQNFLYFYQHIPYHLNPVAFSVFGLPVDWYSLMYIVGFLVVYLILAFRIRRGESPEILNFKFKISNKIQNKNYKFQNETLLDLMLVAFSGLLIGGRLGYVFFYNFPYYTANPLAIISPYDPVTHQFIGIYGMSYHGALIGALATAWVYTKIKKFDFWSLANFIAPAIPAGYFFGRMGNFFNGELYGRMTDKIWGMYFPSDPYGFLRHPSELYEAILEGIVLFLILWPLRNKEKYKNQMLALYIIGYAVARIGIEFFREPDGQLGFLFGILTMGQLLSFFMLVTGFSLLLVGRKKEKML